MKQISARDFQKEFGKVTKALPEGQTIEITLHGKPLGEFTKGERRKVELPDFLGNLRKTGCDPKLGDALLEEFNASVS
jgi:antitoxin (DNA-binding transcriptional repressor) of toxin-antitoxin stability system